MSIDKMKAEFEAAYESGVIYALETSSEVKFEDYRKQCAWAAWQASGTTLAAYLPTEGMEIKEFGKVTGGPDGTLQFSGFSVKGDGHLSQEETILRLVISRLVNELEAFRKASERPMVWHGSSEGGFSINAQSVQTSSADLLGILGKQGVDE